MALAIKTEAGEIVWRGGPYAVFRMDNGSQIEFHPSTYENGAWEPVEETLRLDQRLALALDTLRMREKGELE